MLTGLGYVTLRFDMRGCGESDGEFGRIICLEQVEDTKAAHAWLAGAAGSRSGAHRRARLELRRGGLGLHRRRL